MEHAIRLGCIADDFTGAGDAASFLASGGLKTQLVIWPNTGSVDFSAHDAVVVALKSRSIPPEEAVTVSLAALRWLRSIGANRFYFKYCSTFDSTPQGNIGPVCDAALELLQTPYTLLCPALLANGRTVKDDVLFVNGTPLAESHMRFHPLNPMWDSRISVLMSAQSRYPVFPLSQEEYRDRGALRQHLQALQSSHPHFYLIPDDCQAEDGHFLADFFRELPLLTGGSGLLEDIAQLHSSGGSGAAEPDRQPDPCGRVMFSGSCSDMTRKQVAAYRAAGGRCIVIGETDLEEPSTPERLAQFYLDDPACDILYCCSGSCDPLRSAPSAALSARFEQVLSALAAHLSARCNIRRLIVAGGETSGAIVQALGLKGFRVGRSVAPGVPILYPVEKEGLALVLKSGNFGREDFFLTTLEETL